MKFYIAVEEMRSTVVEVEAENLGEALDKAEKAYLEDKICLDSPDYIDGENYYDETGRWMDADTAYFQKI